MQYCWSKVSITLIDNAKFMSEITEIGNTIDFQ